MSYTHTHMYTYLNEPILFADNFPSTSELNEEPFKKLQWQAAESASPRSGFMFKVSLNARNFFKTDPQNENNLEYKYLTLPQLTQ